MSVVYFGDFIVCVLFKGFVVYFWYVCGKFLGYVCGTFVGHAWYMSGALW